MHVVDRQPVAGPPAAIGGRRGAGAERPAAAAAGRLDRAELMLAALGLGSVLLVLLRLVETWRVTPAGTAHHVSVLGQSLTYPAANLAAVVVLGLALLGLTVVVAALAAAISELRAARRLAHELRR